MSNDLADVPGTLCWWWDEVKKDWRIIMERQAVWPQVRGNATVIVPRITATLEQSMKGESRCPHCGEIPYNLEGRMRRYDQVCGYRPDYVVSTYEDPCDECGHPIAYHGIIGVSFCVPCGGPIRFVTEQAGTPWM